MWDVVIVKEFLITLYNLHVTLLTMSYRRNQRKFSREKKTRNALIIGLVEQLVMHGKIRTTVARAKTIRPLAEELLHHAKTNNVATVRLLRKSLTPDTLKKLITEIGPRYRSRQGGYTRITRVPVRSRDGAPMAVIEFV